MAQKNAYVDFNLNGNQLSAGVVSSASVPLWVRFKESAIQGYLATYKTFTYTSGTLTQINTYDTAAMGLLLLTQVFTYTSGTLTQIVLTNGRTNVTLTRSFTYSSGAIANISEVLGVATVIELDFSQVANSQYLSLFNFGFIL